MSPTNYPVSPGGNVLSWASEIESDTIEQAGRTASLPFVCGHVALMPDAHVGFGSTVGSVIPTKGAIIPSAIGVDIGCGMIAVETSLRAEHLPDDLGQLHDRIAKAVPAGVGQGHDNIVDPNPRHFPWRDPNRVPLVAKQTLTAVNQFGTLGSGNHFVEVCLDERGVVWVVLHSGSRGIGNQLATAHIEKAKGLMQRYFIDLPDPDLAYLVEGTDEFERYIAAMRWAQEYAMGNRETMMDAVLEALDGDVPEDWHEVDRINCHHNYTEREHHRGQNIWVTRKGAIRARVGDRGVIPGSMGTSSYIVSGLGNKSSYDSASHGAGRRMSRGQARRNLDLDGLRDAMEGKAWNEANAEALIDEDPRSYKDIDQVMADQSDLVTIEHTLTQVLNYKGV